MSEISDAFEAPVAAKIKQEGEVYEMDGSKTLALCSIAISLKRIADALSELLARERSKEFGKAIGGGGPG